MRDHGGNLGSAMARWGGRAQDWIDLSTGINRQPWPVPDLPPRVWTDLPAAEDRAGLEATARAAFGTQAAILSCAGAQAAIQMIPRLDPPGRARVLGPTYNEHAASLAAAGWRVEEVRTPEALAGADLAVVVNPNNPNGAQHDPGMLAALAARVGRLVVDESFADPCPHLSCAAQAGSVPRLLVLRSFGKFWGLAGLRLGFVLGEAPDIAALAAMSGPWPVSGPALAIGTAALADRNWAAATAARLGAEAGWLDAIAARAGWTPAGGTVLFRLYETPDAAVAQDRLARARIWSRIFPYSGTWLRLGLPGNADEWARLDSALRP